MLRGIFRTKNLDDILTALRPRLRRCTSWEAASGSAPSARPRNVLMTLRPSFSIFTPSAPRAKVMPSASTSTTTKHSPPAFRSRRPRIRQRRSKRSSRTSSPASRWIDWSAATWGSARPKWRCARHSSRSPTASRLRCSCRRRSLPSSISRRSETALPICRSRWPSFRASAPARKRRPCWMGSPTARSIS